MFVVVNVPVCSSMKSWLLTQLEKAMMYIQFCFKIFFYLRDENPGSHMCVIGKLLNILITFAPTFPILFDNFVKRLP
jgi:hypothetical protein